MKKETTVTVIVPASKSWHEHTASAAGAVLALLVVPIAVIAIGVPVVLLVRALMALVAWMTTSFG